MLLARSEQTATRTAAEWVEGFAEGWRAPTDADSFCDHFEPLLGDEMRLVQPQMPERVGKLAFREQFARPLFSLLHDVRGTVGSWAASEEGDDTIVFVELEIRARLVGGRPVTLRTTDRITLRGGVAVERIANLDPLELLGPVALTPRAWPAFLRARFGR
jgi:ketosteroid isomerase-like protein